MKTIIKLIFTIAIFYFLFENIDHDRFISIVFKSHIQFILIALFFQLASIALASYRWRLIMQLLNFKEKVSFYTQSYFKGMFFNQLLPGSIGGDAIKIYDLAKKDYSKKESIFGVLIDRVIGLIGLLILSLISNLIFYGSFPNWLFNLINVITISGILSFIIGIYIHKISFLEKIKFINYIHKLSLKIYILYKNKKDLFIQLLISLFVHICSVLAIYCIALSIDVQLSLYYYLVAIPPVFLFMIVPISFAGWGIREGAMVAILSLVGVDKEKILVISIVYGIILIISSIPGALFWIKKKKKV
jgi:uncharacterized protein (TIRG00374 family)